MVFSIREVSYHASRARQVNRARDPGSRIISSRATDDDKSPRQEGHQKEPKVNQRKPSADDDEATDDDKSPM